VPEPAWEDPKPTPVEGYLEAPRLKFDAAFHLVMTSNSVYFGSSADNKVYCLDAATGRERWSLITGGPVRFAPQVWQDRVYVASDDGHVYCLAAADGELKWRFQAAPRDDRVLGNGEMISRWPLRTGVLVDNGVVYCTAGVFPAEGAYVSAVDARSGKVIWQNDTSSLVLQGYLLASPTTLFAPMGRVSPCGIDRRNGKVIMGRPFFGKGTGGSYALLAGESVYSGGEQIMGYSQADRPQAVAWFPGRRLVVANDVAYLASDTEIRAVDRAQYGAKSMVARSAKSRRRGFARRLPGKLRKLKSKHRDLAARIERNQAQMAELHKQMAALVKSGKRAAPKLAVQDQELRVAIETQTGQLKGVIKGITDLEAQTAKLAGQEKKAQDDLVATCVKWRAPNDAYDAMILAANTLFVGGQDRVVAVDASSGDKLWTAEVNGRARSIVAANGRLLASTDRGDIYCFGSRPGTSAGSFTPASSPAPYPEDRLTPVFAAAADAIVRQTGVTKGYCLVAGCGTGRLALELAKRTELKIYGVDADERNVRTAREALDKAGLYGTRVSVEQWPPSRVPYPDYFANLVVSETALVTGTIPVAAHEVGRMVRPLGGTICIGQPAEANGVVKPMREEALVEWAKSASIGPVQVTRRHGLWLKAVREALPDTTNWTHQYADAGNTACSMDRQVKCPLGVLWFGGPGPGKMANRHASATAPLCVNGTLLVQGENVVMAYDAYNGLKLWEREIPGAFRTGLKRECGNLCASDDSFLVALRDKCLRLDPATGQTRATYALPSSQAGKPQRWGYIAYQHPTLLGSVSDSGAVSHSLFAVDTDSGSIRWISRGKSIMHIAIAAGDGKLFFVDGSVTDEQRRAVLRGTSRRADVRLLAALDVSTGKRIWAEPIDVSDSVGISRGGGEQTVMYRNGIVFLCGQPWNGHYWDEFLAGEFSRRSVIARSGDDGRELWSGKLGYRSRPIAMDDALIAEPWAYELRTGKAKTRVSPITGAVEKWQMARPGHHCGPMVASASTILCRSGVIAYYDLEGDYGTVHFTGQRPGCHVNFIAANGLLLVPEASSGCMCAFPTMCTVAFNHRPQGRVWARYSLSGPMKPVKHLAVNFGAPGDRKDGAGKLWLAYPRPGKDELIRFRPPGGWLDLPLRLGESIAPEGGYFHRSQDLVRVSGTDRPWVFASGCEGLTQCTIPLTNDEHAPGVYTVRLSFAARQGDRPGQRVFDIRLQGQTVAESFDVLEAARGAGRAITREFKDLTVHGGLKMELVPHRQKPTSPQAPVLNGVEVERTRTLRASVTAPSFCLGDYGPEQTREVRVVNHGDDVLAGSLHAGSVRGFQITPANTALRLAPGAAQAIKLAARVAQKGAHGVYALPMRLVGPIGEIEYEATGSIKYLGSQTEVVLPVTEDAHVQKRSPKANYGAAETLVDDGGGAEVGDSGHSVVYLKFRLDVPGRVKSLKLRMRVTTNSGSASHDAGSIYIVNGDWREKRITYQTQPRLGAHIGKIGKIAANEVFDRPLDVSIGDRREISLAIVPATKDGTSFFSREGGQGPELVVELAKTR